MAPPVTKVVIYKEKSTRKIWVDHGTNVWYIRPSLQHYQCFKCYRPDIYSERNADKVEFFPVATPFLKVTTDDYFRQTATDSLAILQEP